MSKLFCFIALIFLISFGRAIGQTINIFEQQYFLPGSQQPEKKVCLEGNREVNCDEVAKMVARYKPSSFNELRHPTTSSAQYTSRPQPIQQPSRQSFQPRPTPQAARGSCMNGWTYYSLTNKCIFVCFIVIYIICWPMKQSSV